MIGENENRILVEGYWQSKSAAIEKTLSHCHFIYHKPPPPPPTQTHLV
jgi:hypothetical protein